MNKSLGSNVDLQAFNSFGVPATAAHFADIRSEGMLKELFARPDLPSERLVLGGGSNILFTQPFNGLVIKMGIPEIEVESEGSEVLVTAGAGVVWNELVRYCVDRGYGGIENLALIPGTAGAAPVQNIGAYGVELMHVFDRCRAFDTQSGEFVTLFATECGFTYRNSIFKSAARGRYIIVSISLRLRTASTPRTDYGTIVEELDRRGIVKPTIRDVAEIVSAIRVSKLPDPTEIGNAGSFFKNPVVDKELADKIAREFPNMPSYPQPDGGVKLAAGWLIESCGWKGRRVGACGTWKNQALVIVNHGGASGAEIYQLSELIIQDVHCKFGITLEREVVVI